MLYTDVKMIQYMKKVKITIAILLFVALFLYSEETTVARFELLMPTPDPIQAGETLTIQTIVLNASNTEWASADYELEAEIYDSEKKYLMKPPKIRGKENIAPNTTVLIFIPCKIPQTYSGIYYFRVGFYYKKQRILYSDYESFRVNPVPVVPKLRLAGNVIASYRNDSQSDWKNYLSNISLSVLGTVFNRATVCNLYTNHTPDKKIDLYNLLFEYYGEELELLVGDVMPEFSILTVNSIGTRAIYPVYRIGIFNTSLLLGQTVEGKEGSETYIGTYPRYIYGIEEKITLPFDTTVSVSYVQNNDDESFFVNKKYGPPGTVLPLVRNGVLGSNITFGMFKFATFYFDYAISKYKDNLTVANDVTSSAYSLRADLRILQQKMNIKFKYLYAGKDFTSLSSPSVVKDRVTYELLTNYTLPVRLGNLNLSYIQYRDNISEQRDKISTLQQILSLNSSLTIWKLPLLSLGYSLNRANDESANNFINNYTITTYGGITQNLTKTAILTLRLQNSNFYDNKKPENNKSIFSGTVGFATSIKDLLSLNTGLTYAKSSPYYNSITLSLTSNCNLIPAKFIMTLWGDITSRRDESPLYKSNVLTIAPNVEATYYLSPKIGFTLGCGTAITIDNLNPGNNNFNLRLQIRASVGF